MKYLWQHPASAAAAPSLLRPLRLAVIVLLGGLCAAPCYAARSGQRPKVTISVHDTGTPVIGNR